MSETTYYAKKSMINAKAFVVVKEGENFRANVVHEFYPSENTTILWASYSPSLVDVENAVKVIRQEIEKEAKG